MALSGAKNPRDAQRDRRALTVFIPKSSGKRGSHPCANQRAWFIYLMVFKRYTTVCASARFDVDI